MLNIHNAVRQMRVARKLGKISHDQQRRILRKRAGVDPKSTRQWGTMMGLLRSIHQEIAPILHAKRVAERECFDIKYAVVE